MKPIDFIKDWISKNEHSIAIESALYEYDKFSETHFLKLMPDNLILNPDYANVLSDLIISFDRVFPDGGLCLINGQSLIKLEAPFELIPSAVPSIPKYIFETAIHTEFLLSLSEYFTLPNSINWDQIKGMDFAQEFHSGVFNFSYDFKIPDQVPISEIEPIYFPKNSEKLIFNEEQPYNMAA